MAPRPGLTPDKVVDGAVSVIERGGLDALTLGAVAAEVGVRTPSLYNHVGGLEDVRRRVTVQAIDALGTALQRATVGRAGDAALRAMSTAYRDFALAHPGLYAATVPSSEVDDDAIRDAGRRVVGTVVDVLRGYDLDGDDAIHAARSIRAAVHGFLALELSGGFGLDVSTEDSFAWLVGALADGVASRSRETVSSAPRPIPS